MIDSYTERGFGIERRFDLYDDRIEYVSHKWFGMGSTQTLPLAGLNPIPSRSTARDRVFDTIRVWILIGICAAVLLAMFIVGENGAWPKWSDGVLLGVVILFVVGICTIFVTPRRIEYVKFITTNAVVAMLIIRYKRDPREGFETFVNQVSERIRASASAA